MAAGETGTVPNGTATTPTKAAPQWWEKTAGYKTVAAAVIGVLLGFQHVLYDFNIVIIPQKYEEMAILVAALLLGVGVRDAQRRTIAGLNEVKGMVASTPTVAVVPAPGSGGVLATPVRDPGMPEVAKVAPGEQTTIYMNREARAFIAGRPTGRQIKEQLGIPGAYELIQIINLAPVAVRDNEQVLITGGEIFHTSPPPGASA